MTNEKVFRTFDGEKFYRKLPAQYHVSEEKDIRVSESDQYINTVEVTDEELLDVHVFRFEEFWEAVRSVKVRATSEDEAREQAEAKIVEMATEITHKLHQDMDKLEKVDEVPRSKIESGEYYEEQEEA